MEEVKDSSQEVQRDQRQNTERLQEERRQGLQRNIQIHILSLEDQMVLEIKIIQNNFLKIKNKSHRNVRFISFAKLFYF
jgi:hypothetical protein